MAFSSAASQDGALMHDPHYGPDLLGFQFGSGIPLSMAQNGRSRGGGSRGSSAQYDDFSVSANLHVLRPQVLALNPTAVSSVERTVQRRTPNPAVFKRWDTMPAAARPSPVEASSSLMNLPAS